METWQVSLDWEHQVNSLAKRFTWEDWQLEETVYGALPYLRNFRDLDEQICEEVGGSKAIIWEMTSHRGGEG